MRIITRAAISLLALVATSSPILAQTRSVTDDAGRRVQVPERAERLVVMHDPILGVPLLDIGAPVIGAYGRAEDGTNLAGFDFVPLVLGDRAPAELPSGIGPTGAPDLERLRGAVERLFALKLEGEAPSEPDDEHLQALIDAWAAVTRCSVTARWDGEVPPLSAGVSWDAPLIRRYEALRDRQAA